MTYLIRHLLNMGFSSMWYFSTICIPSSGADPKKIAQIYVMLGIFMHSDWLLKIFNQSELSKMSAA